MIEHLRKHAIYQTPLLSSRPQNTIDRMFKRPVAPLHLKPLMSLEQAILEWIVDTL
jgi:hypothetical protein